MRFVKKFEKFLENNGAEPAVRPARPKTRPGTKPGEAKPGRRQRPSPIRRTRPAVEPDPKAKLPTATEEDVVTRFMNLLEEEGGDIKNYVEE